MNESERERLIGPGSLAKQCGVSARSLQRWESARELPPALRITGSDCRVWRAEDAPHLVKRINELKRKPRRRMSAAA
jgi:DNA-binding transcriptional MerR regulator